MSEAQRFSFYQRELPYLPLQLTYRGTSLDVEALLDTGSTVNVLPYKVGLHSVHSLHSERAIASTLRCE